MSGRRQALRGEGVPEHPQPFPPAIRIGNLVFTSAISGEDPATGELPGDPSAQIRHAFRHIETAMRLAGGTMHDVAKMTVYLADRDDRSLVNLVWLEHFPDEDDRPVRHTVAKPLPRGMRVQLEVIGVIETDGTKSGSEARHRSMERQDIC